MRFFLHTKYLLKEIEFECEENQYVYELKRIIQDLIVIPKENQLLYLYEKNKKGEYEMICSPENNVFISEFFVDGDHLFVKRENEYDFDPELEAIG